VLLLLAKSYFSPTTFGSVPLVFLFLAFLQREGKAIVIELFMDAFNGG